MSAEELVEDFSFLSDWEERFRYIVELGRELEPMAPASKTEEHRVLGCQSQVWITAEQITGEPSTLHLIGDSDSQLVRGLIAVVFDVYNDQTPQFIVDYDIRDLFAQLDLSRHLTPSRANGLNSMVEYIQIVAEQAL